MVGCSYFYQLFPLPKTIHLLDRCRISRCWLKVHGHYTAVPNDGVYKRSPIILQIRPNTMVPQPRPIHRMPAEVQALKIYLLHDRLSPATHTAHEVRRWNDQRISARTTRNCLRESSSSFPQTRSSIEDFSGLKNIFRWTLAHFRNVLFTDKFCFNMCDADGRQCAREHI